MPLVYPAYPYWHAILCQLRDDAQLSGACYGLRAVVRLQLAQNVIDVCFHRADSDNQFLGNGAVAETGGDEAQDLQLALGEWFDQQGRGGQWRAGGWNR